MKEQILRRDHCGVCGAPVPRDNHRTPCKHVTWRPAKASGGNWVQRTLPKTPSKKTGEAAT